MADIPDLLNQLRCISLQVKPLEQDPAFHKMMQLCKKQDRFKKDFITSGLVSAQEIERKGKIQSENLVQKF